MKMMKKILLNFLVIGIVAVSSMILATQPIKATGIEPYLTETDLPNPVIIDAPVNIEEPATILDVFPDEAFARGIFGADADLNSFITQAQLDAIEYVNVTWRGIESIEGIQYLHSIKGILAYGNSIRTLEPMREWYAPNLYNFQIQYNAFDDLSPLLDAYIPKVGIFMVHDGDSFRQNLDDKDLYVIKILADRWKKSLYQLAMAGNKFEDFSLMAEVAPRIKSRLWFEWQMVTLDPVVYREGEVNNFHITNRAVDFDGTAMPIKTTELSGVALADNSAVEWNNIVLTGETSLQFMTGSDMSFASASYTAPTVYYTIPILYAPTIVASDLSFTDPESFDPLEYVSATDFEDGDLTSSVTVVSNNVDLKRTGNYTVVYEVTDSDGVVTQRSITVAIVSTSEPEDENNGGSGTGDGNGSGTGEGTGDGSENGANSGTTTTGTNNNSTTLANTGEYSTEKSIMAMLLVLLSIATIIKSRSSEYHATK